MSRLPYPELKHLPPEAADALAAFPVLINAVRMTAHAPTLVKPLLDLVSVMLTGLDLDPRLRESIILAVAHETGCRYEWDQHLPQAAAAGLTAEDIARVADRDRPNPRPAAQAVLGATRDYLDDIAWSQQTIETLRRFLTERELVEMLYVLGAYRMFCWAINALDVEVDASGEQLATGFAELRAGDR